ncbi:MAG: glycosyltransferase family 2 protein [Candidatus Omnitrophota bacterium]
MKLSVVIPAFNEGSNIAVIVGEILAITEKVPEINSVQVVVVDDHSTDDTYRAIDALTDKRVNCLRLSKRSGSHIALRAGLQYVDGDAVLCLSADGQDDPAALKEMLNKWRDGAKVVWALRKSRRNEPWSVRIPAVLFYKTLSYLAGQPGGPIDLSRADFYLLDRCVVCAVNACAESRTSLFGLIQWVGFSHDFVEYDRRERKSGKSKWSFGRRLGLAKDWIIAFSSTPIKAISLLGFFLLALGFLFLFFVPSGDLGYSSDGFCALLIILLFVGGFQMIMLGLLGEYLWQSLEESRHRPLYFIEKRTQGAGR